MIAQVGQYHGEQRESGGGDAPTEQLAASGEADQGSAPGGGQPGSGDFGAGGDDMDVDVSGLADHVVDHRAACQMGPSRTTAVAEDELGGVLGAGEAEQPGRGVGCHDLAVGATEFLEELSVTYEEGGGRADEAVVGADVYSEQLALGALRHARGSTDEGFAAGGTRDGHRDALAGFPRFSDAVVLHVLLQRVLDPVGDPEQGQLAQGGEVAGSEVVGQGRVGPVGVVDVAVGHAPAESLRAHVDQLDLIGGPYDGVGDRLALGDAGYPLDHVVDRLEMLDIDSRDDVDSRVEELFDVLPALFVLGAGHVGMGQLVDQGLGGVAGEDGVDVHLLERGVAVGQRAAWNDFQGADLGFGQRASMGFDEPDDDVGASAVPPAALVEHGVRLAYAGGGPQVYAQRPPGHVPPIPTG